MSGRRWTEHEEMVLRSYAATGVDAREIARTLGRPVRQVSAKAYRDGVPLKRLRREGRAARLLREAERRSRERGWRP